MSLTGNRRVYLAGLRIHHGLAGALLVTAGAFLAWHDRHDFPWPLIDREDATNGR